MAEARGLIVGIVGWLPRLEVFFGLQAGPPGQKLTQEITRAALRGGWSIRPVLWWFQATRSGYRRLEALTPAPLRRLSARRFWGIFYPLVYVLGMAYLAIIISPLDSSEVLLFLGISAIWWGVWGLLAWILLGFPRFWRRGRR